MNHMAMLPVTYGYARVSKADDDAKNFGMWWGFTPKFNSVQNWISMLGAFCTLLGSVLSCVGRVALFITVWGLSGVALRDEDDLDVFVPSGGFLFHADGKGVTFFPVPLASSSARVLARSMSIC